MAAPRMRAEEERVEAPRLDLSQLRPTREVTEEAVGEAQQRAAVVVGAAFKMFDTELKGNRDWENSSLKMLLR